MAASHGQLREYILRKKWDRPAGLAGRFFVLGGDGLPRRCAPRNDSVFARSGAYGAMGASFPTDELEGAAGNGGGIMHMKKRLSFESRIFIL